MNEGIASKVVLENPDGSRKQLNTDESGRLNTNDSGVHTNPEKYVQNNHFDTPTICPYDGGDGYFFAASSTFKKAGRIRECTVENIGTTDDNYVRVAYAKGLDITVLPGTCTYAYYAIVKGNYIYAFLEYDYYYDGESERNLIHKIDKTTREVVATLRCGYDYGCAVAADDLYLYFWGNDGFFYKVSQETMEVVGKAAIETAPTNVESAETNDYVYCFASSGTVYRITKADMTVEELDLSETFSHFQGSCVIIDGYLYLVDSVAGEGTYTNTLAKVTLADFSTTASLALSETTCPLRTYQTNPMFDEDNIYIVFNSGESVVSLDLASFTENTPISLSFHADTGSCIIGANMFVHEYDSGNSRYLIEKLSLTTGESLNIYEIDYQIGNEWCANTLATDGTDLIVLFEYYPPVIMYIDPEATEMTFSIIPLFSVSVQAGKTAVWSSMDGRKVPQGAVLLVCAKSSNCLVSMSGVYDEEQE